MIADGILSELERARYGSRELDMVVWALFACKGQLLESAKVKSLSLGTDVEAIKDHWEGICAMNMVPAYTTSLDAAATLVHGIFQLTRGPRGISAFVSNGPRCRGTTLALALCAAAVAKRRRDEAQTRTA